MEVEKTFELDLPDDEVNRLTDTSTLADLWRLVMRASGRELPESCGLRVLRTRFY